jgi:protoporphyrinogen/coproporphyrinogen III oxidase
VTHIAVVGAGAAGLLAAHRLRGLGAEVTVLEASDQPGGVIATERHGEWLVELGPNTVAEPHPEVRAILDAAGLKDRVIRPSPAAKRRYVVHDGRPVAVPFSTGELVSTPLLSVAGRLRMLKEPFIPKGSDPEETVGAFARRRFGDEAAARFIDPIVAGTSGGDPDRLVARHVFPKLVEYEQRAGSILKGAMRARRDARRAGLAVEGIWSCPDGLGEVPTRLAAALGAALRLRTPVRAMRTDGAAVVIATDDGETGYDGGVATAPAPSAATIGAGLPHGADLARLAGIPHASMTIVVTGYRHEAVDHPLDGFGVLAPSSEQRRTLGTLFPSALFEGRAPAGHVLLVTFVGGMRQPALAEADDTTVLAAVRDELGALLGARGEPAFTRVVRWAHALPQAVAGHATRVATADAVEAAAPVTFAGSWRDGLAVGDAMLGGVRAAERLWSRLAG